MTARSENIDTILCNAVEIESSDERQNYLNQACGHDAELRQKVDELMRNHFDAGSFLNPPASPFTATVAYEPVQEAIDAIRAKYDDEIMAIVGVVTVSTGLDKEGSPCLKIGTSVPPDEVRGKLPEAVLRTCFEIEWVGDIEAQ